MQLNLIDKFLILLRGYHISLAGFLFIPGVIMMIIVLPDFYSMYWAFLLALSGIIGGGIPLLYEIKRTKLIIDVLKNNTYSFAYRTHRKEEILFGGGEYFDSYKIYFKYLVDNNTYYVTHRTISIDSLSYKEPIIYSKKHPDKGILIRELPKHIQNQITTHNTM